MNLLPVSLQHSIVTLAERGWSARRIGRELGIHRETVGRYLRPKPAKVTTGSEGESPPNAATNPALGSGPEPMVGSKPAKVTAGSGERSRSNCVAWGPVIEASLAQGLSAVRIYQDLRTEHGYGGGYESVKRYARRLRARAVLPYRRMECLPGEELQIDFGRGAWVEAEGRRRRPHLFRCVLSYSRKGYTEAVWRQDTETFIRCLENAFRTLGGVPLRLVIDNLKAGVLQADWYDPDLNPKLVEFCEHYRTVLAPTRPATPRHKGKVERGVGYVQENALRGRRFASLAEQNQFLAHWEEAVADTRIHGTVREQVLKRFREQERAALGPLPAMIFPCFSEAKRGVGRDGHVEYDRAYYSVPPEYVGHRVWVRADTRLVRIYTLTMQQIGVHARREPGRFATAPEHIHPHKRSVIEQGASYLLGQCRRLGPNCGAWAEAMYRHRGPYGIRSLQGLLHLAKDLPVHRLESAAATALERAAWRLRDLRTLAANADNVVQLGFLQSHPLIRDLSAYRLAFPS